MRLMQGLLDDEERADMLRPESEGSPARLHVLRGVGPIAASLKWCCCAIMLELRLYCVSLRLANARSAASRLVSPHLRQFGSFRSPRSPFVAPLPHMELQAGLAKAAPLIVARV